MKIDPNETWKKVGIEKCRRDSAERGGAKLAA